MAPDALRRKNLIKPKALPYTTPTGKVYDSGDFAGHMARAQELADWNGFAKRAAASKRAGRLRGIGMATYIEACGSNGPETATVRLDRDGDVTVLIGSQSTGQGHATSYAQLVAERLDLPPERVRVVQGDTDLIASGAGTGGSSSIPVGGVSVDRATKTLAEQLKQLAADALEAAMGDLEIANGAVRVAGTDRLISFADIAAHPKARPEQLRAASEFATDQPTFPNGTHIAEIEIDAGTGATSIVQYIVVDDFGATLNPLLLAGQVHGGAVQGIGQALMEDTVYDAGSGQLLSASLMDYALPRAGRRAGLRVRDPQRAVQEQSARRQRRGRGRRHRLLSGGDERGGRCAVAQPTASAISTCRRPRSGSGRRSRSGAEGGCVVKFFRHVRQDDALVI